MTFTSDESQLVERLKIGLLALFKPKGYTSSDIVVKVRGILRKGYEANGGQARNLKVGHGGTLDPLAEVH